MTGEGWHTLEVKAVDAAGNIGVSRADFVIDHSAPEIVFRDVREGESLRRRTNLSGDTGGSG